LGGLGAGERGLKSSALANGKKSLRKPPLRGGEKMTAEVAILNKLGVALAADSIVTITTATGDKTYNTTNKLFTLSKFHPVGIMIFNGTEFNGIPFELIIKEFRDSLGKRSKKTLAAYASAFVRYLRTEAHVTKKDQAANFNGVMRDFCLAIRREFREGCRDAAIPITEPKLSGEASKFFTKILDRLENNIGIAGVNPNFKGVTEAQLVKAYSGVTGALINRLFSRIMPTPTQRRRFASLLHRAALSNYISDDFSGFVISGFGSEEHYPSVLAYETDGMYANRIKLLARDPVVVTRENASCLLPFAQTQAATLFMEGVNDDYQNAINKSSHDLIVGIADVAAKHLNVSNAGLIKKLRDDLAKTATAYLGQMEALRRLEARSVLRAIRVLDKSEMAILAENIVSLTALKQKISLETETVGGPIDVAFISKNDGFIWIKRKHYFDPDLNPFFFKKYLAGTFSARER
jgi:hypothetical protein